jgi:long-subunit acyl-CoA synthetase (AMP-forming)
MSTVFATVRDRSARHPHSSFLEESTGRALSYQRLGEYAGSISRLLAASGIRRQDRVAILLPDDAGLCLAFLGVSCHCTAAPLNPSASSADLRSWLQDLRPAAMLIGEGSPTSATALASELDIPLLRFHLDVTPRHDASLETTAEPHPDDIALILHTSGTTARP